MKRITFEQFKKLCAWIYKTVDTAHFSLDDCMTVFSLYFDVYRDFIGENHPIPSYKQIAAIMEKMPFVDEDRRIPLEVEQYEVLIPAYFLIDFPNCDYNISHFFSGRIRKNRYYETLY